MSAITLLQSSQPALIVACVVLGLVCGSFLNVVIHRLPKMLGARWRAECADLRGSAAPPVATAALLEVNLVVPRSRCPTCGHRIRAVENIPLLSWLVLRGKCSACRAPISARYPLVEVLTATLSGYVAWRMGFTLAAAGALLFTWATIALAFIDLDTFYLPDDITLPLLWAGLVLNVDATYTDIASAVIGAAAGYLSLWLVYWGFKLATGKEGMGYGDFKLHAAIGAWVGWKMLPLVILLSSFVGALAGVLLMFWRDMGATFRFPSDPTSRLRVSLRSSW